MGGVATLSASVRYILFFPLVFHETTMKKKWILHMFAKKHQKVFVFFYSNKLYTDVKTSEKKNKTFHLVLLIF